MYWFANAKSYVELGEKVLKMVDLLKKDEFYLKKNYTPLTLYQRFNDEIRISNLEEKNNLFQTKLLVLQDRLVSYFQNTYPQFEYEIKYFTRNDVVIKRMTSFYLESIVIHHHHYFPDMDPIGFAHNSCNLVTYVRGQPMPHVYVHNLTNFDSSFMLKMLPPDVMAHKGKNTEK